MKDRNSKNHFSIVDYLANKNISEGDKFVFDTRNVNCADDFNIALTYLVSLYNGPLKYILLGKTWENIHFDWGNYK